MDGHVLTTPAGAVVVSLATVLGERRITSVAVAAQNLARFGACADRWRRGRADVDEAQAETEIRQVREHLVTTFEDALVRAGHSTGVTWDSDSASWWTAEPTSATIRRVAEAARAHTAAWRTQVAEPCMRAWVR